MDVYLLYCVCVCVCVYLYMYNLFFCCPVSFSFLFFPFFLKKDAFLEIIQAPVGPRVFRTSEKKVLALVAV